MLNASSVVYNKGVSMTKAITLRLDPADYDRLEAEAERLGVAPATLARVYVRAGLNGESESVAARNRRTGLATLRGLAALRERLPDHGPPVDVVEIMAESREERDRRLDR
jgi:hypothetical protein